jgi:hypothetical protein
MAGRGACRTDGMKAFKGGKNMKKLHCKTNQWNLMEFDGI